jgi:hypothetical protein
MNIFHSIINLLLIIKIQTFLYLSIEINNADADYCIKRIYTEKNNIESTFLNSNINDCLLSSNNPIIENIIYEFGDIIYLQIYDNLSNINFMGLTIKLNEYIINKGYQKFLSCINCNEGENIDAKNDYIYKFQINSISDLNDEEIEIDYNYFCLSAETAYNKSIY